MTTIKNEHPNKSRQLYLAEVDKQLRLMFSASKDGYKVTEATRHRLEGFMQAGIFLGLATKDELSMRMDTIHQSIFGKSIRQRHAEQTATWTDSTTDYAQFELPSYIRKQ